MKQTKKGFTLVELLVVIAILAVLATVSIVGYLSFINKANISVDEHAVTQFNIVLEGEEILGNVPENAYEMRTILSTHGYNEQIVPITAGYTFYLYLTDNIVVLADENDTIVFPAKYADTQVDHDTNLYINLSGLPYADVKEASGDEVQPVEDYLFYNGSFAAGGDPIQFDHTIRYTAHDSEVIAGNSPYADWLCDFRITVNEKLDQADHYYLGGQYDNFGSTWVVVDALGFEADSYLLLGGVGIGEGFTYKVICTEVKDFQCGFRLDGEHPGFVITVELIIFENYEEYEKGNYHVISSISYDY